MHFFHQRLNCLSYCIGKIIYLHKYIVESIACNNFCSYIYMTSYFLDGRSGGDGFTEEFLTVIGNNVDLRCRLNGASFEWKRENGEAVPDKSFQVG